jgi:hypothetical protein
MIKTFIATIRKFENAPLEYHAVLSPTKIGTVPIGFNTEKRVANK